MRAEHVARRAALRGTTWSVEPNGRGWTISGDAHDRLVEALEGLEDHGQGEVGVPGTPVRQPYPRATVAFHRALDAALRRRLAVIRGDARCGFVAAYSSGRGLAGASLMDVLTVG